MSTMTDLYKWGIDEKDWFVLLMAIIVLLFISYLQGKPWIGNKYFKKSECVDALDYPCDRDRRYRNIRYIRTGISGSGFCI